VKPLDVMVNISGTPCCNTVLVIKTGKTGCVCLLAAVYMHPVIKINYSWVQCYNIQTTARLAKQLSI
jgi:hypothetical protein